MKKEFNGKTYTFPDKKPELLLPAGDLQKAKFAFAFGADAIYAGVPVYALRAKENKFTINHVKEIIKYAHSLGKKVYLTTNIYPHNHKIDGFMKAFAQLVSLNPDAFIVSDPGVISLIRKRWSKEEVELHLSVQQNNVNWASAQFWYEQAGISRVILARELTLSEVKEITQKNPSMEFEYFVHGAMCIAYSGRCLLSNYFAHRDANQGVCAQSCRWQYRVLQKTDEILQEKKYLPLQSKGASSVSQENNSFVLEEKLRTGEYNQIEEDDNGTYILNSRDLCMIDFLPELIDAGVDSFKIEGRNKSVYYAAIAAKAYRQAIDNLYEGSYPDTRALLELLQSAANRGFTPGLLRGSLGEHGQRYEGNTVLQSHLFLGIILDAVLHKPIQRIQVDIKNKIDVGDRIEIITPQRHITCRVKDLTIHNKEVFCAHPGQKNVQLTCDISFELYSNFALLRRKGSQQHK
ncbi:MAG: U32 family peptidase C-terminal domain-containing protein [Candidatus Nanoarchaeia archaeon]